MDVISGRRVAGFIALGGAILIGTVAFGMLMASCQPAEPDTSATLAPSSPIETGATDSLASPMAPGFTDSPPPIR
jgi:hypothetical protein